MRRPCLAVLLLTIALPSAQAQAVHGFYLQGNAGIVFHGTQLGDATLPSPTATGSDEAASRADAAINGGTKLSESGSLGYGLGHGLRVEVQGVHLPSNPAGN